MAFGLGKVATNLRNTVAGFNGVFQSPTKGPYPQIDGVTSQILANNWKLSLPYSFKVESFSSPVPNGRPSISGLFKAIGGISSGGLFDEFILPVNPSDISQTEQFSIVNTPTQRGIISEHNGIVFRELIISGTTGQRPNSLVTGYETFLNLRNYFRAYAQIKKLPEHKNAQLIFINRKDNERLIVEPVSFTMQRSKDAPFLYHYAIVMRVLGIQQNQIVNGFLGKYFNDFVNVANKVNSYVNRGLTVAQNSVLLLQSIQDQVVSTILTPFEKIRINFKNQTGQSFTLRDVPDPIKTDLSKKTIKSFLDQAKALKNEGNKIFQSIKIPANTQKEVDDVGHKALNTFTIEQKDLLSVSTLNSSELSDFNEYVIDASNQTKQFYVDLYDDLIVLRDDTLEKFNINSDAYNSFSGRTNKFTVEETKKPSPEELDLVNALELLEVALNYILSTDDLFNGPVEDYISDVINNYDDDLNIFNPTSIDEIVLQNGKTLEDLAAEYLGTAERWIDIAIVNNLLPPYIDDASTSPRVKRYGDKIFIPRVSPSEFSNVPNTKTIKISENLNETERNLGVDVRLNPQFDFTLDTNNDLKLIAGGENAGQAVVLKITLEKGSLKYHPQVGVGLAIGEKIRNGDDIRDDIINSILSDPRFDSIKGLDFLIEDSVVKINLNLLVKYLDTPVPISFLV